jgi:hypothetical protein
MDKFVIICDERWLDETVAAVLDDYVESQTDVNSSLAYVMENVNHGYTFPAHIMRSLETKIATKLPDYEQYFESKTEYDEHASGVSLFEDICHSMSLLPNASVVERVLGVQMMNHLRHLTESAEDHPLFSAVELRRDEESRGWNKNRILHKIRLMEAAIGSMTVSDLVENCKPFIQRQCADS